MIFGKVITGAAQPTDMSLDCRIISRQVEKELEAAMAGHEGGDDEYKRVRLPWRDGSSFTDFSGIGSFGTCGYSGTDTPCSTGQFHSVSTL